MPARPSAARELNKLYLTKAVAAAVAMEDKALTGEEVRHLIDGTIPVPALKAELRIEVENMVRAFNTITGRHEDDMTPEASLALLCSYHRTVLHGLPRREDVEPGMFRKHDVVTGNSYKAAPAADCAYLVERLFEWLYGPDFELWDSASTNGRMGCAILRTIAMTAYLEWIYPFGPGGGRALRLLEYHMLISAGVPAPAAQLPGIHYQRTRPEYLRQLEAARRAGGGLVPFFTYAMQGFVEGLREQMDLIAAQEQGIVWEGYVGDVFSGRSSPSDNRQKHLALDIGARNGWIEFRKLTELSPRVAREYAARTAKTLSRDVHELIEMELIVREGRKVRARHEAIRAFTPFRMEQRDTLPMERRNDNK
jgi:hypothetical protein